MTGSLLIIASYVFYCRAAHKSSFDSGALVSDANAWSRTSQFHRSYSSTSDEYYISGCGVVSDAVSVIVQGSSVCGLVLHQLVRANGL